MLCWTKEADPREPAFETALTLVKGDPESFPFHDFTQVFSHCEDLLLGIVRQHCARFEYTVRLDKICEGAFHERIAWPMPGRGLTRVGFDDMRRLNHERMLLSHALAPDGTFRSAVLDSLLQKPGSVFDERLLSRMDTLAQSLRADLDKLRFEDAPVGQREREQTIILAIRDAAGLPEVGERTYPWFDVPWVGEAVSWLQALPARAPWQALEPVHDADALDRPCG